MASKVRQQTSTGKQTDDLAAALGQPTPTVSTPKPVEQTNPITGDRLATLRGECRVEGCHGVYRSLSVQKMQIGGRIRYLRCSICTDTSSEVVR